MECLHPNCPMGKGLNTWQQVVDLPALKIQKHRKPDILKSLNRVSTLGNKYNFSKNLIASGPFKRILKACPCLYTQLNIKVTAAAVVHLCEVTLGTPINSSNVLAAFEIQDPRSTATTFKWPPRKSGASGGDIMEELCSEVLHSHGVPHVQEDPGGWPEWIARGHISLNRGKMTPLKLYGDILIPAAPHNILVSVKSVKARERFVVSGNRLESIGFGFFDEPGEFWTHSRINLLKRWGFVAVYMPKATLDAIEAELKKRGDEALAININGKKLFRPLEDFGADIARIAGKLSMDL